MKKRIAYIIFFLLAIWFLISFLISVKLTHPANCTFTNYLNAGDWQITTRDKVKISASFYPNTSHKAIILLSGIGGNRTGMIERTKFYLTKGFNVLTPDLRGTGKSASCAISFGWKERLDILACIDSLKAKGFDTIAIHGHSLGAASILYSLKDFNHYYFVVLESPYDNIDNATKHRIAQHHVPYFLFLPTTWITEWRLNIDPVKLAPENAIKNLKSPVLYFGGDHEWQVPVSETYKIYNNCPSVHKKLHIFTGGVHENFAVHFPDEYFTTLNSFIDRL